jgi:DedD protein
MPGRGHSDWYPLALIVATALTMFVFGSVTAVWLLDTPLPVIPQPKISMQGTGAAGGGHPLAGTAASRLGPASASPQQRTTSGTAPSTAATGGSSPPPTAAPLRPSSAAAAASGSGAASPATPQGGNFSLQLGAFLDETKAKSVAVQVATRGYAPVSVVAADGYGRTWHYVRLGAFADERAAALAASDLLVQAGIGAAVVRLSAANAGG